MYMMFQAIAKGSWKAPLIICFVIMLIGLGIQSSINSSIADQEEALRNPQPAAVSLDVFDRKTDVHVAKEVHVTARMNTDYNYRLIEERDGRSDTTRYMYVFFGPSQAETSRQARAAVILDRDDKDMFADLLVAQSKANFDALIRGEIKDVPEANLYQLAGTRDRSPDLKKIANKAFKERGLTKSPDFIYIEPFLEGRTAGLTPDYEVLGVWKYIWGSALALFALITAFKFVSRHKWQEKRDAMLAAKAYQKAAKSGFAPHLKTAAPSPSEPKGNLIDWAKKHPILAGFAVLFILLLIMPGRVMAALPVLIAVGFVALNFRREIRGLLGKDAPPKGTTPDGMVQPEPTTSEPPKYKVPPLNPTTEPTPTPRVAAKPTRRSVLNRGADQSNPVMRKQSIGDRLTSAFSKKQDTSDPFQRLNRG